MTRKNDVLYVLSFLLLCIIATEVDAASSNLTRPNCQESCGDVTIPFPFGIGDGCFLDEDDWYEIECRQNNKTPFLKKIDLKVRNITLPDCYGADGMISIDLPIASSSANCTAKVTNTTRLKGSQFILSQSRNVFSAVGCDVNATLSNTEYAFVGCKLNCERGSFGRFSSCSGFDGCCQNTIPFGLQDFSVDLSTESVTGMDGQKCSYAFVVNQSWFQNTTTDLDALKINGSVPAVLEWGISNATDLAARLWSTRNNHYRKDHYGCTRYSLGSYSMEMPFLQCYCGGGYTGNPYLNYGCQDINECDLHIDDCGPKTCVNTQGDFHCVDGSRKLKFSMIGVGSGIGALLLLLAIWWLYKTIKRRKVKKLKKKYFKRNGGLLLQEQLSSPEGSIEKSKLFNQTELEKATDNFNESRVLGRGGQGTVFKGMLADGRIVAIKKALVIDEGKVEQFINEVLILSQINHRNIVKLLGCCLETEIPLLVYEFIPNGTLYDYLHDSDKEIQVSWEMRLQLAIEIASALSYLHSAASIPIYHRDIKSTNILLDEKYRAKIADFGTSKSVSLDQTHVTTLIQGTFGYLDPEYFQSSQFTDKSDVYSFGVVLVELLTGQKPICSLRAEEGRSLATYFILSVEEGHLFDILDAEVAQNGKEEEIVKVAKLAERCLYLNGRNRPTMKEVAMELEGIKRAGHLPHIQQNIEVGEVIQNHYNASTSELLKQNPDVISLSDIEPLLSSGTQ